MKEADSRTDDDGPARPPRDTEETVANWIFVSVAFLIGSCAVLTAVAMIASPSLIYECAQAIANGELGTVDTALSCFEARPER